MATMKLKFRRSSVSEAEGTLYYQVIHNRNVRLISSGYRIFPEEWDANAMALAIPASGERRLDLLLIQTSLAWEINRRMELLHKMEISRKAFSLDEVCEAFKKLAPCKTVFAFLQEQVKKKLLMKRRGTATTYANAYKRFREFRKEKDLTFESLNPDLMEHYEAWLIGRGMKQNTIRFYLRTLNTLLYKAIYEGLTTDRKLFERVKLSYVRTNKRAISERDLKTIEHLQLAQGSTQAFARDIFMFSFYMRGMPFVDIAFLKKSDLKRGILGYCRKKTNQYLEIEWEPEQQAIVDRYAHLTMDSPYMFPIISSEDGTEYQQYRRVQEKVNRALKRIGDRVGLKIPVTTYVARHTWASIARNMDFSIAIISEGMGHHSYKTTQVYLDSIDTAKINEANKKIIRRISRGR